MAALLEIARPPNPCSDLVFWTLGGQMLMFEPVVGLNLDHLNQVNTEHNAVIWSLHPVGSNVEALERQLMEVRRDLAGSENWDGTQPEISTALGNGGQIAAALLPVSRYLLLLKGHALFTLEKECTSPDFDVPLDPEETLTDRKNADSIEPLRSLINRLEAKKEDANDDFKGGRFLVALRKYWEAAVDLCPWTSSPLLFLPWDVYKCRLPELEPTLWLNMAMTARRRSNQVIGKSERHMALKMRWLTFGIDCAWQVIESRYVSRRSLAKAYEYVADVEKTLSETPAFAGSLDSESLPGRLASSSKHAQIAALIRQSEARNPASQWAHEECVFDHRGCGCDLRSLQRQASEGVVASPRSPRGGRRSRR